MLQMRYASRTLFRFYKEHIGTGCIVVVYNSKEGNKFDGTVFAFYCPTNEMDPRYLEVCQTLPKDMFLVTDMVCSVVMWENQCDSLNAVDMLDFVYELHIKPSGRLVFDMKAKRCTYCGQYATGRCSCCLRARYCNGKCQRKDWFLHQKDCIEPVFNNQDEGTLPIGVFCSVKPYILKMDRQCVVVLQDGKIGKDGFERSEA